MKIGWGKTALDLAKERGHREVTRLLGGGGGTVGGVGGVGDAEGVKRARRWGRAEPDGRRLEPRRGERRVPARRSGVRAVREGAARQGGGCLPGGIRRRFSPAFLLRQFASSRALLAFVVVTLLLLLGGLSAIRGMRNELAEWRALREKKAARREKAEKAAAFKSRRRRRRRDGGRF